ncbi:transposase [Syntrophorhabdus aromaticivorans]|uniref:transposase n=1 Tax=Syntrophorhabdus aromaticivorans TaxID=328301 RepID=UPI000412DD10|nr:transposase [Syntrophorhabdus aromaticivorans]
MMGYQPPPQESLFHYHVYLEDRVRADHPLRKVKEVVDFDFIYAEVKDVYGTTGNVSVPPPVILKLMFLLLFYNVRSERELMETLPERLDWLWFLGYGLDSSIPNHSVLSKARKRWGESVFRQFFERIVVQCVENRLVDGEKVFMDASLIDAHASNGSVINTGALKRYLNEGYQELERRLDEANVSERSGANGRHISTTDPDASVVRYAGGKSRLRYKTHRSIDALHEVITAVETTTGAVSEASRLASLVDAHTTNTGIQPEAVVADSQYGAIENLLICHDRNLRPHMPTVHARNKHTGSRKDIYPEEAFVYEESNDTYRCPAGKTLTRRAYHSHRHTTEYMAKKKDCKACELKDRCTRDNSGRSVQRAIRKDDLDAMYAITKSPEARRDLRTRQHCMERSYARSTRYGFDRARWRGLWKVAIQEYLICTIQNIQTLIRHIGRPVKAILCLAPIYDLKAMGYKCAMEFSIGKTA